MDGFQVVSGVGSPGPAIRPCTQHRRSRKHKLLWHEAEFVAVQALDDENVQKFAPYPAQKVVTPLGKAAIGGSLTPQNNDSRGCGPSFGRKPGPCPLSKAAALQAGTNKSPKGI
jgi:hypothetical protein